MQCPELPRLKATGIPPAQRREQRQHLQPSLRIGHQLRHDLRLPHVGERVLPRAPRPRPLRRRWQRAALPAARRPLAHSRGRRGRRQRLPGHSSRTRNAGSQPVRKSRSPSSSRDCFVTAAIRRICAKSGCGSRSISGAACGAVHRYDPSDGVDIRGEVPDLLRVPSADADAGALAALAWTRDRRSRPVGFVNPRRPQAALVPAGLGTGAPARTPATTLRSVLREGGRSTGRGRARSASIPCARHRAATGATVDDSPDDHVPRHR